MGKIERIKLRDFKSFRNAVLPFIDGFVCVVGPNGSGKSNILDAILFVLGEGSMKALRAGRVKDLVHHSSKTGTAEVTIELRKGTEKYSITREIDKQGVSVYRLNGKRTTRSQIQEFIASLGIPPEGYNIILQGDVTNFIKMSPGQRRQIIEEIAGISEYEEKKEKALLELQKVEDKIREANILLHERKGYIGELKKERDEAIRYRNYKQKLELIRANLLKRELEKVQRAFDEKLQLLTSQKSELQKLELERDKLESEIKELQSEIDRLNKEIVARGEKEHLEIGKKIEATRTEIRYLQEKYASLTKRINEIDREITGLTGEISRLEKELAGKRKSLEKLEKELADYGSRISKEEKKIADFKKKMEEQDLLVTNIAQKLDEYTSEIRSKQEEYYSLLSEMNVLKERISVLKLSLDRLSREVSASEEERRMEKELESLKKEIAAHKRIILGFEDELSKLYEKEKELNLAYQDLDREIDRLKEKYHSIQSKITTIKAITGNEASEAVLEASKRGELSGVLGKVEDLFDYPEEYAVAVQTAAGARMNFIVTKDDVSATNAIKWLKKKRIGRTTFIPLNKVRPVEIDPELRELLDEKGVIGFVIDLIKFDKKLTPVFQYVFGDTLIVENIDVARRIGFGRVRMVTLDGDLAEASGVVTGGYKQGVLTLKELREKDELKKKIEELEKKRDRLLAEIERIRKEEESKRKEKNEVELRLREKETELKALESRLSEYLARKSRSESERSRIEKEIEEITASIREKETKARELKKEIDELERKRSHLKDKLDKPEVKEAARRLETMQRELEKLKAQATEIEIRYNSLKSEVELLGESKLKELVRRKGQLEEEKRNILEELESIKNRIFDLEKALSEMLEKEKRISAELSDLIEKREELQNEINEKAEKRGGLLRLIDNKRRDISELEIEKAKLETRLVDLKTEWESLRVEFKELDKTDKELREEMESIKKKMAKLEPVNMKAIEMYEKALEDLKEIEEKAKKLSDEKAAVIELINQIEKKKREVFMKTFEEIRKNFQRVYKEFYQDPNAYADIKLENLEDPFSGGLIVEARPAGKPIRRIEALSGGEQAVVALTFLFAVQDYKPSPFYALDEADAPLDKANSERLAKLIKERSKVSQFIVITHNASLIHEADQIIGVSMNKKLGSSVVEVDMRDYVAST